MDRFYNEVEDAQSVGPEFDDLDTAEELLMLAGNASASVGATHALRALALIQLWYAKQHRAYRDAVEKQRQAMQAMQPPPAPPMPTPYPGAF